MVMMMDVIEMMVDMVDMDILDMNIVDMDILSLHNFLSGRPFCSNFFGTVA